MGVFFFILGLVPVFILLAGAVHFLWSIAKHEREAKRMNALNLLAWEYDLEMARKKGVPPPAPPNRIVVG